MTAPAISIQGLSKRYDDLTALHGIDLEVQQGEFFGLLGPNGAGKTTTINILSGLCVKTAGTVQLFGYDLVKEYRRCRELVGLVPQEFNFDDCYDSRNDGHSLCIAIIEILDFSRRSCRSRSSRPNSAQVRRATVLDRINGIYRMDVRDRFGFVFLPLLSQWHV